MAMKNTDYKDSATALLVLRRILPIIALYNQGNYHHSERGQC